jgi:hypothetical protein
MKTTLALLLATAALAGCMSTSQYATFVTKTSLSIVDVDTTPPGLSLAFDRVEGYVGPRFDDGTVYPVAGYLRTKGSGLFRETQQVYAGGHAARLALSETSTNGGGAACSDGAENPAMIFATGTTIGIKLGFIEGTALPNSFTLGYRRKEASAIPVSRECQPSVLAYLDSDSRGREVAGQPKLDFGVAQYFATGAAADALAAQPFVRAHFTSEAQAALGEVAAFNAREAVQTRMALDVITCAGKVPDARFDRVITNAEDLKLFADDGAANRIRGAGAIAVQRRMYTEQLGLRLGDTDERTAALRFHKQRVCELAA